MSSSWRLERLLPAFDLAQPKLGRRQALSRLGRLRAPLGSQWRQACLLALPHPTWGRSAPLLICQGRSVNPTQVWEAWLRPRLPGQGPHRRLWWCLQRCALAASHLLLLTLHLSHCPYLRQSQGSRQAQQRHSLRRCSRWALHQLACLSLLRGRVQQQQRCPSLSLLLLLRQP